MPVSLDKIEKQAGPDFTKRAVAAEAAVQATNLPPGHVAKVALVVDVSYSMSGREKEVDDVATRLLALATRFDDDGDIEVFEFGGKAAYKGAINLGNYKGGVGQLGVYPSQGSTNYEAAIRQVLSATAQGILR